MDLSIIIVNYETYDLTKQTIESVINHDQPFEYDIYLVDNGSKDGSIDKLKKRFLKESEDGLIKFIINIENRGFAFANNLALQEIKSKYILLLNSDTVVVNNCLEDSLNYMNYHKDVGALGCKVVLPDSTLDKACRRSFPDFNVSFYRMTGLSRLFPKSERFGRYNLTYLNEDETYEVDCIVGAFMLVRSQTIQEVGFLDESFFMYGEDIDWCYRIKAANWKIIYYSDAKIIHYKGASNSKKQNKRLTYEFYRAMYLFYNKHYKDGYPWITTAATYLGIWGICSLKMFKNYITR
ncbi:glycosyltransferase family 2 protein [Methanobacterium spitsbergense]|uniref:Glycosyltransferase family 2 protein n=1 Tax=Methanobacterium spitsbergense TaxID=2874285 RepID=A0A8T5USR9_9EURY|nr:glycosyltransferase family 2 protein [Methanobacterium spitsbergense]MBZ2167092.1 glycosyltransferase family 2 protein [Methanobacterium spitsbergense]